MLIPVIALCSCLNLMQELHDFQIIFVIAKEERQWISVGIHFEADLNFRRGKEDGGRMCLRRAYHCVWHQFPPIHDLANLFPILEQ